MQCDSDEEEVEKPNVEKKTEVQSPPKSEPIIQCVFCQVCNFFLNLTILSMFLILQALYFDI